MIFLSSGNLNRGLAASVHTDTLGNNNRDEVRNEIQHWDEESFLKSELLRDRKAPNIAAIVEVNRTFVNRKTPKKPV